MLRLVVYSGLDLHPSGFSYQRLLQPLPIAICSFTNPTSLNLPFQEKDAVPCSFVTNLSKFFVKNDKLILNLCGIARDLKYLKQLHKK